MSPRQWPRSANRPPRPARTPRPAVRSHAPAFKPLVERLEGRLLPSVYTAAVLQDGPVAYWRLGEADGPTAFDASGHGATGTYFGGVLLGRPGAPVEDADTAARFDGLDDHVRFANPVADDFTVEAWVKTTAAGLTGTEAYQGNGLVWSDVAGDADDWVLAVLNDRVAFHAGDPGRTILGATPINDGGYHHVAVTRVRGGEMRLYVDGVLEAAGSTGDVALNANPVVEVGGNTLDGRYFDGTIDEVALYTRALSADQVLAHFRAARDRSPVPADDRAETDQDVPVAVPVLANDGDPDGDPLAVSAVTQGGHGSVTAGAGGTITYSPAAGFTGTDTFTYTVADGLGGTAVGTVTVTVRAVNVPPAVHDDAYDTAEDVALVVGPPGVLGNDADADGDGLAAELVSGPAHGTLVLNADGSFTYTPHSEFSGTDRFTYVARSAGGTPSAPATAEITVTPVNDAPVLDGIGNKGIGEGCPLSFVAHAADVDSPADALRYSLHGAPDGAAIDPVTGAFSWTPADDGTFTFVVRATDSNSLNPSDEEEITVTVANVAPTVSSASNSGPIDAGVQVTVTVTASDPAGANDPLLYDYDSNNDGIYEISGSPNNTHDFVFADSGDHVVKVRVRDGDGGEVVTATTVTVNNVAPTVGDIAAPLDPVAANNTVNTSASFADAGVNDTHTAVWDWGDGSCSPGTVTEAGGSGSVAGSHTYTAAGVYTVTLTVTDNDGGTDTRCFRYVVVYDAAAGFVTGGGWIASPAGALAAAPALTGRANFGFVSKYQKGTTVPTGQTEFQFQVGNLNFHSTSYDWLAVAGARAQYKGSGTVNGSGNYKFLLTAIDGQRPGGGGVDKFRIKIWDAATGSVVYDNQIGQDDAGNPTTALGGGSIKIHS